MRVSCLARLGSLGLAVTLLWPLGGIAGAPQETPAATRQYAAAARLQKLKSYKLAADAWREFAEKYPTDPRLDAACYNLGVCCYLDNQFELALASFQRVVREFPRFEKLQAAYLYLGATQYSIAQSGKTEMCDPAVQAFDALIAKYPQGEFVPDALYYRGECLYMQDKKEEAAASYRELIQKHPKNKLVPDALYALGVCYEETGRHQEAGKTYDTFLKTHREHALAAEVTLRRGETLLAAKQYPEAIQWFAAAAAKPGFDLADYAVVRQADCLAQTGQPAQAAALYESVLSKFPGSEHVARATLAGGKCRYLANNYAEARKLLSKLLEAGGPSAHEAAHWIARSWLQEKQPEKAVEVLEKVIPQARGDKSPWVAQLLMDRADAVYEIPARRKEAIGLYQAIAELDPKDPVAPQALYMAGFAALEQGSHSDALKHADGFLAAYAEHELVPDVTHIKAESHLLLNQLAEAEALYGQLLQRHPNHPDVLLWMARRAMVLQLQKKHQETIRALEPVQTALGRKDPSLARRPDVVAEAQHLAGISQLELQQYEAAAKSLEAAIAAQPKWRHADETLLALARAYGQLGDPQKAKATVERVLADFPESGSLDKAHYRLGEYSYLTGDFKAAAAEYRKVIDGWPESALVPYALHELGCAEMDLKDNAGAEQTLTRLLEQHREHPLVPSARFSRGMARHRLQKFAPAAEDLQAFLATDPPAAEKSDARYLLGLCQMGLNQHEAAIGTFRALLQEDPGYGNADNVLYQLAWATKLSGDEAEAAKTFQQLAMKHPQSPRAGEAYYHIGEFTYQKEDYPHAAAAYYKAMQQVGKSDVGEKAVHKLGWSYYHQNALDDARKTFRYQLGTYPKGSLAPDAAFMEAECFFKQEKFQEALDAYGAVENLTNEDFQALLLLHAGQAAGQLKQWETSLQFLDKCAAQFPDSPRAAEAFYERGWAHQQLGKVDLAQQLYEQVIGMTGGEVAARAQFMIGEIQFGRKDYDEAIKSYFKVMYGYSYPTWQAEATFEAARCFEVLRRTDQAVKLYQELVEKFPKSEKTPVAKQRIQELSA